jgi:hypothetical protein
MHFDCAGCQWSEGDDAPADRFDPGILDQIIRFKENQISRRELYEFWNNLVHSYGSRSVTFDKDRLPAIAGLARIIGEALQDQYLAGLWKGDVLCGLLWGAGGMLSHGLEAHLQNIRRRNYVAPSWSWAACPAIESMRSFDTSVVEESTVVDIDTETNGDNPYGQVSGGFLRIRGKMAPMPTRIFHQQVRSSTFLSDYTDDDTYDDFLYTTTDWIHTEEEVGLENLTLVLLLRFEADDETEADETEVDETEVEETEAPELLALLLHPVDGSDQYYRVGMVKSRGKIAYDVMRAWFKDSREETICII